MGGGGECADGGWGRWWPRVGWRGWGLVLRFRRGRPRGAAWMCGVLVLFDAGGGGWEWLGERNWVWLRVVVWLWSARVWAGLVRVLRVVCWRGAGHEVVLLLCLGVWGSLRVGVVWDKATGVGVVCGDVVAPSGSVVGSLAVGGARGSDAVVGFGRGCGTGEWSAKGCVDMVGMDVGGLRACRRHVDRATTGWAETLMWSAVVA